MSFVTRDMLCLIDWKTSKKPKPLLKNTYDDPLQIAAYMGALNSDPKYLAQVFTIYLSQIYTRYFVIR